MIKLAFLASHHAFSYHNVGGTDSLVRRLSQSLTNTRAVQVDLLTYGHVTENKSESHSPLLRSCYFSNFRGVLDTLAEYDHVMIIYLPPSDRLKFLVFRQRLRGKTKFHMLFLSWPDSSIKRWLMFLDAHLVPFNGQVFGISARLVKHIHQWNKNATLLRPPVPQDYFVPLAAKSNSDKTRVTFLGREDPGKGALETIELFNRLSNHPDIELSFYGMHWPHRPESVRLHERLMAQERFPYTHVNFDNHSESVDKMVRTVLRGTDIFVQPYRKLSSTIDTPLLILEAMASLAAVLTKPYGNIPEVYGPGPGLLGDNNFIDNAASLILSAKTWLPRECQRINQQNKLLKFDTRSVVEVFSNALQLA